jgi:hypothetical protein
MNIMEAKPILDNSEPASQEQIEPGHLHDGLRILARLIARDLIVRLPTQSKKNDILQANDESLS